MFQKLQNRGYFFMLDFFQGSLNSTSHYLPVPLEILGNYINDEIFFDY